MILINKPKINPADGDKGKNKPTKRVFNTTAAKVMFKPEFANISFETPSGQFRCAGSTLDACTKNYNWRNKMFTGFKNNGNKTDYYGATNAWNAKRAGIASGAGEIFYDYNTDGAMALQDLRDMEDYAPSSSLLGWGDAVQGGYITEKEAKVRKYNSDYGLNDVRRSRHMTSILGKDINDNNVNYDYGSTRTFWDKYKTYDDGGSALTPEEMKDSYIIKGIEHNYKNPNYIMDPAGRLVTNIHDLREMRKFRPRSRTVSSVPVTASEPIDISDILK